MVASNADIEEVLRHVSAWPAGLRLTLARRLLDSLAPPETAKRGGYSAAEAAALVNSRQPAPDDEAVRHWLEQHRAEKYAR